MNGDPAGSVAPPTLPYLRYRPNFGGDDNATMIAPQAVITVGTAAARVVDGLSD